MGKFCCFIVFIFTVSISVAQTPRVISFQGMITDANGQPATDGSHTFRLKLYDAVTGGNELFGETQNLTSLKGIFNAIVGTASGGIPDSLLFDRPYFLGVTVDGTAELTPRTQLIPVPYALRSSITDAVAPGITGIVTNLNGGEGALTLRGSGGTTINRSGDTITISSADASGGTGIQGLQSDDGSIVITNPNGPIATIKVASSVIPWTTSGTNISNTNSGNVGIGTNAPASKLDINGTTKTKDLQVTNGALVGRTMVSTFSGMATWTSDLKILGGNVGIGDTTPKAKLHVAAGNSGFDPSFTRSVVVEDDGNLTFSLRSPGASEQSILFERPVGDTGLRISSQPDGDMRIGRYRFTDNGSASSSFHLFLDVQTGNFGIKRDPITNDFEVDGTASKTTAGDWLANSDRRIKTDITDISESFKTVLQLRPVKFRYSDEWRKRYPSIEDRYYYNFIAQEYQQVFPDAVKGSGEYLANDSKEILQIDTYDAQIVSIKAVQDLIKENIALKEGNVELQKRVAAIEAKLTSLQQTLMGISVKTTTASLQK